MTVDVIDAYAHCSHVTRTQAKNFSYGIRLLPPDRRQALSAVYAFARRIDDIGDGGLPATERLSQLEGARRDLEALTIGEQPADDPVLVALHHAAERLPIPLDAFGDLIDGVEMDVHEATYEHFDHLLLYCHRVAGSIGRLALGTFVVRDRAAAEPLADALGVALQLTNILRDLVEDRAMGRVYVPRAELEAHGLSSSLEGEASRQEAFVRFQVRRASDWFDHGLGLLPLLDRTSAACVGTMAGIYRRLLVRIEAHPERVFTERVSLPKWEKGWLAARSLAGPVR
ncbi:MAG: phytoene/squalene synthase family protein [Egibacteraceae bacterium]